MTSDRTPSSLDPLRRPLSWAAVAVIRLYQLSLSRYLGGHCRFLPTCSDYCMQAIVRKGLPAGLLLGAWRIIRCNPLSRGGYDPVR